MPREIITLQLGQCGNQSMHIIGLRPVVKCGRSANADVKQVNAEKCCEGYLWLLRVGLQCGLSLGLGLGLGSRLWLAWG